MAHIKCCVFGAKRVGHLTAKLCPPKTFEGYLHTRLTVYKLLPPVRSDPFSSLVIASLHRSPKIVPKRVVTLLKWAFDSKVMPSQSVRRVSTHSSRAEFATYHVPNLLRLMVATRLGHMWHEL
ncbi:hypothetical protein TorRG33x02_173920 [Trema orientale]|uniref:Uncharacterized protein n=1 Tax=Trema orientale TaxID=63057 RepID=A0A2P5EMW0_TREOI|nr:hypothetical protein TorRG33x02_173920 [Trema orientale]